MGATRVRLGLCIALSLVCMLGTSGRGRAASLSLDDRDADNPEKPSDTQSEGTRSILHSFALYILASEIHATMRDGVGDESTLAKKYADHPGWIPAFAKSSYNADEDALYVPLGQFVWKIKTGREGEMQFSLLSPKDRYLENADKQMLVCHLVRLVHQADMRRDTERAFQTAQLAGDLLYPQQSRGCSTRGKTGNSFLKPRGDFDHSL